MIYVFPIDEWGCGYYRLIWPVEVLKAQGYQIKIIQPGKHKFFVNKKNDIMVPPDTELVVMQRPSTIFHMMLIAALRKQDIAVVVDMDDDITAIDPTNIAYRFYQHHNNKMFSWRYSVEACKNATLVTTSTESLLDVYDARYRGAVLPNCVPAAYLRLPWHNVNTFGWSGNSLSHYTDLAELAPSAQNLVDEGYDLRVVGGDKRIAAAMRLRDDPTMTGDVPILRWAQTISEQIGVGLVPLSATKFNKGKSWLKGIEYMSVGVPWVASPREEYHRLSKSSGCGFLADSPSEWQTMITKLLTDDALRHEQAAAGYEYMKDKTYEAQAWRWAEVWDRAISIQRGRMT